MARVAVTPPRLCAASVHARQIVSGRGSTFIRCGRSDEDPRYPRYPRLPILRCRGFLARPAGESPTAELPNTPPADAAARDPQGDR